MKSDLFKRQEGEEYTNSRVQFTHFGRARKCSP
jgi:hypothetical protein